MEKLIIHNPKREDRYQSFIKEFREQGLADYKVMPSFHEKVKPCTNISKAHKNCIKYALDNQMDMVLVMEDDIHFLFKGALEWFVSMIPLLPPDWLLFSAGAYDAEIISVKDKIAVVREMSGFHCYIVHSRFYDVFLSAKENMNIDRYLSGKKWGKNEFHLAYPILAIQHDGWSDNVQRNTQYNRNLKNKLLLWEK